MTRRAAIAALALAAALGFAAPAFSAAAPANGVLAITNARIVPVTAPEIASGTILIRDGKIEALGADVAVPPGAAVYDAKGLTAYPGMIDAYCYLGLSEISGVSATVDQREAGRVNPQARSIEALRSDSIHIPISRSNGITAALVAPSGGFVSGMSCLVRLDGWTNREMLVRSPAALQVELPGIRGGGRGDFGGRMGAGPRIEAPELLKELKGLLDGARAYAKRRQAAAADRALAVPDFDETAESLQPVVRGEVPVMFSVHSDKDILAAIAFVKDQGLKAVFYGVEQGWKVPKEIAASGIPCVMGSLTAMPPLYEDGYDSLFRNAGVLRAAGVKVAFASASSSAAKDLPYMAAKAAAFGLDRAEALKAVTIAPAEIFGVDKEMGSLAPGKSADIALADGDILELRTNVKQVFVKGRACDMTNRYTELLDKFLKRDGDKERP